MTGRRAGGRRPRPPFRSVRPDPRSPRPWPSLSHFSDFDGVSDSYATAAERVEGLLFPAGEAWRSAWARDPDLALHGPDGFHPTALGSYLAALVMYEQLSGRDSRALPPEIPMPSGPVALQPAVADLLEEAAVEANDRFARTVTVEP